MKYDTNDNKIEIASVTSNKKQEGGNETKVNERRSQHNNKGSTNIGKEIIKSFSMLFFVIYVVWILNTLFLK